MADHEDGEIRRLYDRAQDDPGAVRVDPLVAALDGADGPELDRAVGALYEISKSDPERVDEAIPALVAVLDSDRMTIRSKALLTAGKVGEHRPSALVPHADALTNALEDDVPTVRRSAAVAVRHLATADPAAAEPGVPTLLEMLHSDSEPTRRHAIDALQPIASGRSSTVEFPVEPLLDVLEERHEPPSDLAYDPEMLSERATANDQMRGLRTLANDENERSENARRRESAAELLATVAANQPARTAERLEPHADRLGDLLDDRNPIVRGAIVGVTAYVAEHDPAIVGPYEDQLVDALEEPIYISGNAVWALRFAGSERSMEVLRTLVDDEDAEDDLRAVAERALEDVEP